MQAPGAVTGEGVTLPRVMRGVPGVLARAPGAVPQTQGGVTGEGATMRREM